MLNIRSQLETILEVVPPRSKVVYVDYPMYHNIGDLAILLGAHYFLQENFLKPIHNFSVANFPWGSEIPDDTVIMCQGGGNFGDLWGDFQKFRERLVASYPRNRIVMLPQSIYFADSGAATRMRAVFERHNDLHIFARERNSREHLLARFPAANVQLCPDMAHALWPRIYLDRERNSKELYLFRDDKERNAAAVERAPHGVDAIDWSAIITPEDQAEARKIATSSASADEQFQAWLQHATKMFNRAMNLFAGYGHLTTDRLHGHIIACLTGLPNTFVANAYHKNESYYETWTKPLSQTVKFIGAASRSPEN